MASASRPGRVDPRGGDDEGWDLDAPVAGGDETDEDFDEPID